MNIDSDECEQEVCDHYCKNTPGSFKCACYDGYLLVNHVYCKPVDSIEATILVSQVDKIINSSIDGARHGVLYGGLKRAIALDYHYQKKLIFFTDVREKKIYRASYGSSGAQVRPIFSLLFFSDCLLQFSRCRYVNDYYNRTPYLMVTQT